MAMYPPLPAELHALLRRYQLLMRESVQPNPVGGQLMRRKGQGFEFREHTPYLPGEDVRFIDWRASARFGDEDDLLTRSFVAEEKMQLLISLDARSTMRLPTALPKLLLAQWLIEALVRITQQSSDTVLLHWLFDQRASPPVELRSPLLLRSVLEQRSPLGEHAPLNVRNLRQFLPPTAIWLIITDGYFDLDEQAQRLAEAISSAQSNMCWVMWLELDSWPHERSLMGQDVWQIETADPATPRTLVELSETNVRAIEQRIAEHRAELQHLIHLDISDQLHWAWPDAVQLDSVEVFNKHFFAEQNRLHHMFMKQRS